MSNSRGGFFSFNRLLGKKSKNEKNVSKSFSKSTLHTLTRSTTNLEEISPQNKITPLTVVPNAPFEQSFRITVYLPHGQLYVARIGAKTKLSELLDMICKNKLLDASKFEFRHPTDDTQVFDFNFTIGEVGLNEIKLAHKNGKDDTFVKYRTNNQESRLSVRPHTIMSSVSPYSSTNSLNSSDSSGITMNQRVCNSNVTAAPTRKKRAAPRPPSQNSIPEDAEQKNATITEKVEENGLNRSTLARHNFHVSSPNLCNTMKSFCNNNSSTDTSIASNPDGRQSESNINTARRPLTLRPLSMQLNRTTSDEQDFVSADRINSTFTHSRTSSEASDITRESSFPEPQPRKRPPINKKKAPAPPPRTVSSKIHCEPVATPRCTLQKLNEEETKDENANIEKDIPTKVQREPVSEPPSPKVMKNATNVSKVMLNVDSPGTNVSSSSNSMSSSPITIENTPKADESYISQQFLLHEIKSTSNEKPNVSKLHINCSLPVSNELKFTKTKAKKISVVDLNGSGEDARLNYDDVSKQVNEIIDEAVKINEAKLNAENEQKSKVNGKKIKEINNNGSIEAEQHKINGDLHNGSSAEVPIQPIINETRTFDFTEYSDNSLPTSTTSTMNTTETPSTGPESLITSDIEDGYKGNELEKKRKSDLVYDSKEDFIESQFGFLSEHIDNKTNTDSEEEKTLDSIKSGELVSSTMIGDKFSETYRVTPDLEKTSVINELTEIINCNRLETFIKPNVDEIDPIVNSKRSTLNNFQISTYSNGNHEKLQTSTDDQQSSDVSWMELNGNHSSESNGTLQSPNGETFVVPKKVVRSRSFHSTFAGIDDRDDTIDDSNVDANLATTPRSTSYLSLNNTEQPNNLIEKTRQKSASELSIADIPSLQSIEIMKSILNSSRTINTDSAREPEPVQIRNVQVNQRKPQEVEEIARSPKQQTSNEQKAWKYQGPPAINLLTWGERPKSMVHIKSDSDYIFGGTSKVAALQKRFSGINEESRTDTRPSDAVNKSIECDGNTCKLPIVRGVEYKKNASACSKDATLEDSPDSVQCLNSFRSSYEISRIVSKPFAEKAPIAPKPIPNAKNVSTTSINNVHSNGGFVLRAQSFNGQNETTNNHIEAVAVRDNPRKSQPINRFSALEKKNAPEAEQPLFSQFTLRKTGLKEKILDDQKPEPTVQNAPKIEPKPKIVSKVNAIPTAPKPPPMLKKPLMRPISIAAIPSDPRDELLNSIRNFKRDALKRNCIY